MSHLVKIGNDVCGPYTDHQVVGYFDAGHINAETPIVDLADDALISRLSFWTNDSADPAKGLDIDQCPKVKTSKLFKQFPQIRATVDNPSLFYLSRIVAQQGEQIRLLRALRLSVAGIGIALAIVFFLAGRH